MIIGINTNGIHKGQEFHIQCEDLGDAAACFEIRVYIGGHVIWQKRQSYRDQVNADLGPTDRAAELKKIMEKLVRTVQAAIASERLALTRVEGSQS